MTTFDRSVDGWGRYVSGRIHAALAELQAIAARANASRYLTVGGSRRFRAVQRARTRHSSRLGFLILAAAVAFDGLALIGLGDADVAVALILDVVVLAMALVGWWLLPTILRGRPELVAWVVTMGVAITTVETGLTVPSLTSQTNAYLVLIPSLVALVLPWRTVVHLRWLLAYAVVATAYLVLASPDRLPVAERADLAIVLFVGLGVSLGGHMLLQRAQISAFAHVEHIKELRRQADTNMAELERAHQALELTARVDPLTGAGNRRRLDEDLRVVRANILRSGMTYGLIELDLDHFKGINDSIGHLAGDDVLRRVVTAIQGTLRSTDAVYRYGGEEFVVMLPISGREGLVTAAERLRRVVLDLIIEHPTNPGIGIVSVSIGATQIGSFNLDLTNEAWFAMTDKALYEAKAAGRNAVRYVTEIA